VISAIVLAAGRSRRMGRPKMSLPWGETTVIGQVVAMLAQAGLDEIVLVTGGDWREVENSLNRLSENVLASAPVRTVFNPSYAKREMSHTLKVGLSALGQEVDAAMIALGDQPQVRVDTIVAVLTGYRSTRAPLVVPSYQMRRGHPWIVDRSLWSEILALDTSESVRDLLTRYEKCIHYVLVDTPTILQDLDTPEAYQRHRPDPG